MKFFFITLVVWLPTVVFSQNDPTDCEELDLLSFNDTSVCGQAITLTAIAGLDNYSWSTGSDNQFTSISLPGTYTVSTSYNSGNFVVNGNFNQENSNFSSAYLYSATSLYPEGTYSVTTNANNVHSGFTGFGNGGGGNFMVVNGATSAGLNVWCQDIEIEPETTYNFSTSVSTVANGNQALLQFSINGETIGTSFSAPNTTGTWSEFNATWNSNTSTNAEICIVNQNTSGGGNDFGLDDISFSTLCSSSESITVTEIDPANATIFNVADLCESGPIVNLNAVDAGGTLTGNGISNANTGAFDPNLAGPGTHNITYTIDGACGDVNTIDVTVVQETESSITAPDTGTLKISNKNLVEDSSKNLIIMGRNIELTLEKDGVIIATFKVPYGAKLYAKPDDQIKKGQKICDWDPYTVPVIAETSGIANYVDLVDAVSIADKTDEATGISSKIVLDWRSQSKNLDLKPRVTLRDSKDEVVLKADGNEARYYLSPETILSVSDGDKVNAGDVLARLPKATSKTKDITGGLPRVAELFEARKPKDGAIIAENDGEIIFGKEIRGKQKITIKGDDGLESNYLIPKGKQINYNPGEKISKGEYLLDGSPATHDILRILGIEALTDYFVNEVQDVYRLQGVVINDKHIEVILRQMLRKLEVKNPGDSEMLSGEIVDKIDAKTINEKLKSEGKKEIEFDPVMLGITKASLQTKSFISAASFQETTRVLTDASLKGKSDDLMGLKENVIVGRLIPAGSGQSRQKYNKIAKEKDLELENKMASETISSEAEEQPVEAQ